MKKIVKNLLVVVVMIFATATILSPKVGADLIAPPDEKIWNRGEVKELSYNDLESDKTKQTKQMVIWGGVSLVAAIVAIVGLNTVRKRKK